MKQKFNIQTIVWLSSILLFSTAGMVQASSVKNVVSVDATSNGAGESATIHVKTTVDGEVVEEYHETSATGQIQYESNYVDDKSTTTIIQASSSADKTETVSKLRELQQLLLKLLELLTGVAPAA